MKKALDFIVKHKLIIFISVVAAAALAIAFISGGNINGGDTESSLPVTQSTKIQSASAADSTKTNTTAAESTAAADTIPSTAKATNPNTTIANVTTLPAASTARVEATAKQTEKPTQKPEKRETTAPVQSKTEPESPSCVFSISCATVLNNLDKLDEDKLELIPSDGWIYPPTSVKFNEGDSVYDILQNVCRTNSIHLEAEWTPIYGSAYISGINNLYEFDCGASSGWTYFVNDEFPSYGVSKYYPKSGDTIRLCYTCVKGDVGVY